MKFAAYGKNLRLPSNITDTNKTYFLYNLLLTDKQVFARLLQIIHQLM